MRTIKKRKYYILIVIILFCISLVIIDSKIKKDVQIKNFSSDVPSNYTLAYTLNGVSGSLSAMPRREDGYRVNSIECTSGVTATWHPINWTLTLSGFTGNVYCNIDFTTSPYFVDKLLVNNKNATLGRIPLDTEDSTYVTSAAGINFETINSTTNGLGMYKVGNAIYREEGVNIYYFRGNVTNNYLLFNNKCWRIVRTTHLGGVKIVYAGLPNGSYGAAGYCHDTGSDAQIGTSAWNPSGYKTYTGYMTGTTNSVDNNLVYSNTTNSTIKQYIDTWYGSNMTAVTSYLENSIWCNDRTEAGGTCDATSACDMGPLDRVWRPSFVCPQQRDKFTLAVANGGTSGYGNNKLIYPVAMLTSDEVHYTGGLIFQNNTTFYLHTGVGTWTLSPSGMYTIGGSGTKIFTIKPSGDFGNETTTTNSYGVRPAVTLKSTVKYSSGNGTAATPYQVTL